MSCEGWPDDAYASEVHCTIPKDAYRSIALTSSATMACGVLVFLCLASTLVWKRQCFASSFVFSIAQIVGKVLMLRVLVIRALDQETSGPLSNNNSNLILFTIGLTVWGFGAFVWIHEVATMQVLRHLMPQQQLLDRRVKEWMIARLCSVVLAGIMICSVRWMIVDNNNPAHWRKANSRDRAIMFLAGTQGIICLFMAVRMYGVAQNIRAVSFESTVQLRNVYLGLLTSCAFCICASLFLVGFIVFPTMRKLYGLLLWRIFIPLLDLFFSCTAIWHIINEFTQSQAKAKPCTDTDVSICSSGHTMVISSYVGQPYYGAWVCNTCKKKGRGNRWLCEECFDDYCLTCRPPPVRPSNTSAVTLGETYSNDPETYYSHGGGSYDGGASASHSPTVLTSPSVGKSSLDDVNPPVATVSVVA